MDLTCILEKARLRGEVVKPNLFWASCGHSLMHLNMDWFKCSSTGSSIPTCFICCRLWWRLDQSMLRVFMMVGRVYTRHRGSGRILYVGVFSQKPSPTYMDGLIDPGYVDAPLFGPGYVYAPRRWMAWLIHEDSCRLHVQPCISRNCRHDEALHCLLHSTYPLSASYTTMYWSYSSPMTLFNPFKNKENIFWEFRTVKRKTGSSMSWCRCMGATPMFSMVPVQNNICRDISNSYFLRSY